MSNTYIDCITYSKAGTGLVLQNQYGNIGRIAACSVGATSLTLVANQALTAQALSPYDDLYLFDGINSEHVQVGNAGAAIGATSIPLQAGTQYAHIGGTPYCTDGTQGSLGQAIFEASRWIEDICHQSLWGSAFVNEILTMPTMRASIDNQWCLHFRPRHFPITTFTSISLQLSQMNIITLDPTQAIIDSDQQTVDIPNINFTTSGRPPTQASPFFVQQVTRASNAWLNIAYSADFASLPATVTRAAKILTNECIASLRENPFGADSIQQNKRSVTFVLRGDQSGESVLVKKAKALLAPYITKPF